MNRWSFSPYNLDKWNDAKERILFVAPEPNGDNPNSGVLDMGDWFRNARDNGYYKNKPFFRRCEIILTGILGAETTGDVFNSLRFVDLKAIQGGAKPDREDVMEYVVRNISDVTKYFNSTDRAFGLSPHIVVLLGRIAQPVFVRCIRHKIMNNSNIRWVGMPSLSHMVSYVGLRYASGNIRQHLKPINEPAEKWVYRKNDFDVWLGIL